MPRDEGAGRDDVWVHEALLLQVVQELFDKEALHTVGAAPPAAPRSGLLPGALRHTGRLGLGAHERIGPARCEQDDCSGSDVQAGKVPDVVAQLVLMRVGAVLDLDPDDDIVCA